MHPETEPETCHGGLCVQPIPKGSHTFPVTVVDNLSGENKDRFKSLLKANEGYSREHHC